MNFLSIVVYILLDNIGKETIVKVTDWLRGIWEMRRRTGPVQQWVDSIPSPIKTNLSVPDEHNEVLTKKLVTPLTSTEPKDILHPMGTKLPTMTVSAPINVPTTSTINTSGLPRYYVKIKYIQKDPSEYLSYVL